MIAALLWYFTLTVVAPTTTTRYTIGPFTALEGCEASRLAVSQGVRADVALSPRCLGDLR